MKRILGVLIGVAVVVAGILATGIVEAGGGGGDYACNTDKKVSQVYDSDAFEVTVRDACFGPVIARVAPGTELRWTNRGQQPHNIVDVNDPAMVRPLQPNASVTMNFEQAGAFVYYCSFHPGMTGAVLVGDSLGDVSPIPGPSAVVSSQPPLAGAAAPAVAGVQLPAREGDGVPAIRVVLLSLAVGTVAGSGATLLTRRLDRR